MKIIAFYLSLLLLGISVISCVEEFKFETKTYTKALVVESTITDELAHQKVKLSFVSELEKTDITPVKNAQVLIKDSNNFLYSFTETESGIYLSTDTFKAVKNNKYTLYITTSNGNKYESRAEILTPEAPISNLYGKLETIHGQRGVQIYLDNNKSSESAKFFRFEYIETYKIVTPYVITKEIEFTNVVLSDLEIFYDVVIKPVSVSNHICYSSEKQKRIIQTNITGSSEDNVRKFPIRFLLEDDTKLIERYSINVKQYTQSFDSYNYYKTISDLGSIGSLLEENQAGYVTGNMFSKNVENEKVVGFFEVASVSSKRIYFNYSTFNLVRPHYPYPCNLKTYDYNDNTFLDQDDNERILLYEAVTINKPPWNLLQVNNNLYVLVSSWCSDCSIFSSTIKPTFWED